MRWKTCLECGKKYFDEGKRGKAVGFCEECYEKIWRGILEKKSGEIDG